MSRGYSLAEMVVAVALTAVLGVIVASLLHVQFRVSRQTTARLQLESNHLLLQEALRGDVARTPSNALSLRENGAGLALQPADELTNEGNLAYSTRRLVVYRYRSAALELQRHSWSANPPVPLVSPPERLSQADWLSLDGLSAPSRRNWTGLRSFAFTSSAGGAWIGAIVWVDCEWVHAGRSWQVRYCLRTRQRP